MRLIQFVACDERFNALTIIISDVQSGLDGCSCSKIEASFCSMRRSRSSAGHISVHAPIMALSISVSIDTFSDLLSKLLLFFPIFTFDFKFDLSLISLCTENSSALNFESFGKWLCSFLQSTWLPPGLLVSFSLQVIYFRRTAFFPAKDGVF